MPDSLTFRDLTSRLIHHLNQRVRRGELTERGLASLTGYSQPHVHNVLKGVRRARVEFADQVMTLLGIPFLSLFSQEELAGRAPERQFRGAPVDLLEGHLGAGARYPRLGEQAERRRLAVPTLSGVIHPVAAQVSTEETSMWPLIYPGDVILLDRSPSERRRPRPDYIYAVCWRRRGYLGRCLRLRGALIVMADNPSARPQPPTEIPLQGARLLDIVRGKVVWVSREVDRDRSKPVTSFL